MMMKKQYFMETEAMMMNGRMKNKIFNRPGFGTMRTKNNFLHFSMRSHFRYIFLLYSINEISTNSLKEI